MLVDGTTENITPHSYALCTVVKQEGNEILLHEGCQNDTINPEVLKMLQVSMWTHIAVHLSVTFCKAYSSLFNG